MSSDISRQRFNPANDFSSVLMQQGRVQLDADWNEWNEILDRRWRSETIDIIGRCVVPLETPAGFEIKLSGGSLTIGRGRIYVHGLQAENHGDGNLEFDPILAESRGVDPLPYEKQPYYKDPEPLPEAGGPHLVYLDVWEREVTYVEDPNLVENAVAVDTTSRLQTAWQVRVLSNVGDGATCATPDEELNGWLDIIRPSAGRLTTKAVGVATPTDPCLIPPSGGYRGLENRTYRVEIHDGGEIGDATFKWSRDNASVASGVSAIENDITLTVDRAVWDSVRRFSPGDWVEITDDWREFSLEAGEIRQIDSVNDSSRTITLKSALTAGLFPVNAQNLTDPERHTRIKRWDQDPGGLGSNRGACLRHAVYFGGRRRNHFHDRSRRRRVSFRGLLGFRRAYSRRLSRRTQRGATAWGASSLLPARDDHLARHRDRLPYLSGRHPSVEKGRVAIARFVFRRINTTRAR